jgi:Ammonium Transporter Family
MAIPIGILGALGFYAQDLLFEHVLYIDDPLGASALHMGAGIAGVLAPAFFAHPDFTPESQVGIFYGGSANILGWQIGACLVYGLWGFGATAVLAFWPLHAFGVLRVSEEHELKGLDLTHHGGPAYEISQEEATYQLPATGGTSSIGTDSHEATKQLDIASGFDSGAGGEVEGEELLTEQPDLSAEILKDHPFAVSKGAM